LEIPVATKLVDYFENRSKEDVLVAPDSHVQHNFFDYKKRETTAASVAPIGGSNPVEVVSDFSQLNSACEKDVLRCNLNSINAELLATLKGNPQTLLVIDLEGECSIAQQRDFFLHLEKEHIKNPVLLHRIYDETDYETLQLKAAADFGALLIDGFGDGIMLTNKQKIAAADLVGTCFGILQASRVRFSKTEYISCPGCGRTLFNLQETLQRVKATTSHLKGLKIAVMGCIVNGPGEMADADYGYVGAGANRVSLYKGKECVARYIPEENAVDELIALLKGERVKQPIF
jgi:(E)-4-hydroxy-3-methylbut-2-enyl-diphosphate synthase